jgi:hypothetical protein
MEFASAVVESSSRVIVDGVGVVAAGEHAHVVVGYKAARAGEARVVVERSRVAAARLGVSAGPRRLVLPETGVSKERVFGHQWFRYSKRRRHRRIQ